METTLDRLFRHDRSGTGPALSRGSWLILRGGLALLLGAAALLFPARALFAFTMVFAAFAFVDGLLSLIGGLAAPRTRQARQWALILRGLIGILIGGLFVLTPYVTMIGYAAASLTLLALWSILTGVLEISAAVTLRREIKGEWLLALSGLASILLGLTVPVFIALFPAATLISAAWMIGVYALLAGVVLIVEGARSNRRPPEAEAEAPPADPQSIAAAHPAG